SRFASASRSRSNGRNRMRRPAAAARRCGSAGPCPASTSVPPRMEPGGIDAEGDTVDAIHAAARELARGEVARGEGGVDDPADVPHVPLDTAHDGAPDRPLARATR